MFAYRQRGLVTLHSAFVAGFATALLPLYGALTGYLPVVELNETVSLVPYSVAVFLAMAATTGLIRRVSGTLHVIGSIGAFSLAAQQTAYMAAALFTVVFALKDKAISRLFLGSYLVLGFFFLSYLHAHLPAALARLLFPARNQLPTVFVGRGDSLEDLDSWISSRGHIGIQPVGLLSDEEPTRGEKAVAPYLGRMDQLEYVLKERAVAQVILLDWHLPNEEIEKIVEVCEQEGVRFLIHNNYSARFAREMTPVEEGGRHFLVMQAEPLEDPVNRAAKRMLDIAISLPVCLLILPPLCLLVWAMQRTQAPGPLFF